MTVDYCRPRPIKGEEMSVNTPREVYVLGIHEEPFVEQTGFSQSFFT